MATINPRTPQTGTSYNAQGLVPTPAEVYRELGSQQVSRLPELVPELATPSQRLQAYDRMLNNDVGVDVSLRAGKAPVLSADYFMEPGGETPEDQVIADFVTTNIFEGMSVPFLMVLSDILTFYEYGASVFEKVFELREWSPATANANTRKFTMIKKLAMRPIQTISEFQYDDNGGPAGVVHRAIRADGTVEEVPITIDKLMIFTHNKRGGNLEGRSLLRTAHPHWYYKHNLYKIDAIQKERHAIGVPDVELQPGYTEEDKKIAHEMARNLRTNEYAFIVRPAAIKVSFAKLEGQLVDVLKSVDTHNAMIMLNVMVQFLLMGIEGNSGGRASAGSHQDMFIKTLKYVANMVCEFFNMYLIPQLVTYNFKTTRFPRMKVRNIGETKDLQMWAAAMANLIAQKAITIDEATENWIREQVDMPNLIGMRPAPAPVGSNGTQKGNIQPNAIKPGNVGKSPSNAG